MVPGYATAPVLILVGALMFKTVTQLRTDAFEDLIPSFLTIVLIPLTFSITQGILWASSPRRLYTLSGRRREIHPVMAAISIISLGLIVLDSMQK